MINCTPSYKTDQHPVQQYHQQRQNITVFQRRDQAPSPKDSFKRERKGGLEKKKAKWRLSQSQVEIKDKYNAKIEQNDQETEDVNGKITRNMVLRQKGEMEEMITPNSRERKQTRTKKSSLNRG